jgi:hypothetical protein
MNLNRILGEELYMKQIVVAFLVALTAGIVVFGLPSESQAQVTISGVTVSVAGGTPASFSIWSSQVLNTGQTLVLAQNAAQSSTAPVYNFDISDVTCPTLPKPPGCPAAVVSGTVNGVPFSFTDTSQALTLKNQDVEPNIVLNEAQRYTQLGSLTVNGLIITVSVGYADNLHTDACGTFATSIGLPGSSTCFPEIFGGGFGATQATFFQGTPQFKPVTFIPGTQPNHCTTGATCWDSGAILFSATTAPPSNFITVTQGGWGAPPNGNNPGAFLVANFASLPSPFFIGCTTGFTLTFTSAGAIEAFLPQGGPPGVLDASATNPTSRTSAGVFAGQVLALQLNVSFSNAGKLPPGLAGFVVPGLGVTVGQVLADANKALGGCGFPSYAPTASQLNDIVTSINEMFD